ncbi:MAG: hypothetical protein WCJ58_02660 [bacterium]
MNTQNVYENTLKMMQIDLAAVKTTVELGRVEFQDYKVSNDIRLDNVEADIKQLKVDVRELKLDVKHLKKDVSQLKYDVANLKIDVAELKNDVAILKQDVATMKDDIALIKDMLAEMFNRFNTSQVPFLEHRLIDHEDRIVILEHKAL